MMCDKHTHYNIVTRNSITICSTSPKFPSHFNKMLLIQLGKRYHNLVDPSSFPTKDEKDTSEF